jgi:uncharacterized protein (TIGR04255 family)
LRAGFPLIAFSHEVSYAFRRRKEQGCATMKNGLDLIERSDLPEKPLVEAILDIRWELKTKAENSRYDPYYKVLVGRLYSKVCSDYPAHVQKPEAILPDEMIPYTPQHQFRVAEGEWPLIQLGPGILSVNDTRKYTWTDFRARACNAIEALFDSHPQANDLRISSVLLRYVNAVNFDYFENDVFVFLKEKMRITVGFPDHLLEAIPVETSPHHFNMTTAVQCNNPKGKFMLKFATGLRDDARVLLWETWLESADAPYVPKSPTEFINWIDQAHILTHNSFFKLIEGELERGFRHE